MGASEGLSGRDLIDAERERQQAKGYSVHHDREHGPHALYKAANCYERNDRQGWPWSDADWKPRDLLTNLVRAGALYQAALAVANPAKDDVSGWAGEKPKHIRRRRDDVAAQIDAILGSPVVAARESAAATRARVEVLAVVPDECWVTRHPTWRCTAMIGAGFPNQAKWTEEMCCLPCRVRTAARGDA